MAKMETLMFMAALICLGLSGLLYLWQVAVLRRRVQAVTVGADGASQNESGTGYRAWDAGRLATMTAVNGLIFLTLSIVARTVVTGRGPFSNMYEYNTVVAWGVVVATLYFQWRYRTPLVSALAVPIAAAFLIWAYTLPSRALPLVPALQQSLLLTVHVAVAMIASGFFAVGFGAEVLYLVQRRGNVPWLPAPETLDDMGYRATIIGFPFWTLMIILGALWADIAWGRYWGWDPKETASLVTWFIYGGYLHARTLRGWRGTRSATLLIIGFVAVVFTYFGNYFFGGLHAYG